MIATQGIFPSRNLTADPDSGNLGSDPYLGAVGIMGTNFAPRGWLPTNGQLLDISSNTALFSILGTTYGGDGRTTFALPDLRGRIPIGPRTGPGLPGYNLGQKSGTETETLTVPQMPAHVHTTPAPFDTTGSTGGSAAQPNMQPYLGLNYIINLVGTFPSRSLTAGDPASGNLDSDPLLGGVSLFAGNFAPRGWALADGQLLQINDFQALFSILGTTYGGDGRTTFALPDLRGRAAIGPRTGPGLTPRTLGQRLGEHEVTVTENEMRSHTHTLPGTTDLTDPTGLSQPIENMQPSLGLNYVVALQGVFPSRNLTAEDPDSNDPDSGNLSANPLLGSVSLFAGNFAPRGWAFADGQLLQIASNTALFSLYGTTYGGDGRTTFGLPDLRGRAAMHFGHGPGLSDRRLGNRYGQEDTSLSVPNLPNHNHSVTPEPSTLLIATWALLAVGLLRPPRQRPCVVVLRRCTLPTVYH